MIKKGSWAAASMAALFSCVVIASALAQDVAPPKAEATPQAQTPPRSYRLDYTLTELADGKKIDSRQYSISVGGGTQSGRPWQGQLQIGTKVPAGMKSDGTNQYLDVGTKISGVISMRDGAQVLETNCDVSSVAPDEAKVDGRPILRTLFIRNETPVVVGKAVTVATA
ncbi:MAG TPA: hypothetical protein VNV41_20905, partial [Candidatus Acidoferrales bacterium]|nr:hypothetical protein [Candidatus Acidoferrales bacterium]